MARHSRSCFSGGMGAKVVLANMGHMKWASISSDVVDTMSMTLLSLPNSGSPTDIEIECSRAECILRCSYTPSCREE